MSMCKKRAWELLNDLSFVRVAGTEAEVKAANIIKEHCEKAGIPAVIEDFEIDTVEIDVATLEVLEPEYHAYPVIGIGKTPNTPEDGVIGGFKYIEEAMDANLTDVEGKIVLLQGRVAPDTMKNWRRRVL